MNSAAQASSSSHEAQVIQWELDAARHYQSHQQHVGTTNGSDGSVFQLASTGVSQEPTGAQLKQQLDEKVRNLESRLTQLNSAQQSAQEAAAGKLHLTDEPAIQPTCRRIPGWMAMSVLVLGFAVGASAGWLQLRLQSGGVFDPHEIAEQLSRAGVPNVASVSLCSDPNESSDWISLATQKASEASRKGGRNLILLSEGVLAMWCLIILARLVADPLWRSLLFESPLAALGRLLTGMP